jgi:hypothetical protein
LLSAQHTARELRPDHQHVVLRNFALIAVILLIDTVEFEKLVIILGKWSAEASASVPAIVPASGVLLALRPRFWSV